MTPLSLSTSGRSWVTLRSAGTSCPLTVWPAGRARSPTKMVPSIPLGTWSWPWWWAWYMATAGWSATNSYGNDSPGSPGGGGGGVVHGHGGVVGDELVRERLPRFDERLGDGRDAVHGVVDVDAVEVQVGAHRELVVQHDAHAGTDVDPDLRPGHGAVVGPGVDLGARLHLPRRDLGRELELVDTTGSQVGFEDLVAGALGLGRVLGDRGIHRLGHLLVVAGGHLVAGMGVAGRAFRG